ncbi:DUF924 domain-containing protein [Leptolyngbya sp. FACHB-36]|uniref:DUF924 family protein n=1 Tax=Leptolyngbya sp. FACHB-36 TaxID=2692808 RepID=UPI0016814DC6|nr:DUF924 family protein [Leptolyngbya sp. FACHB-36]MBD2018761.1 DUF924 domain-containing protein [Leptolyngbya sp. FACHB-36]
MTRPTDVVHFWFNRLPSESGTGNTRRVWFSKDPDFDHQILMRFQDVYQQAASGAIDDWQTTAEGSLALILVLDQFPRNMFRGQPQAFATDAKAQAAAIVAIQSGQSQELPPVKRWFVYLPLMHSENLEHQRQCVELFHALRDDPDVKSAYPYAIKHLNVIEQFGRFPHRNAILGRDTTPEEAEFLKQPGSSF